jgi:hypothetical protein
MSDTSEKLHAYMQSLVGTGVLEEAVVKNNKLLEKLKKQNKEIKKTEKRIYRNILQAEIGQIIHDVSIYHDDDAVKEVNLETQRLLLRVGAVDTIRMLKRREFTIVKFDRPETMPDVVFYQGSPIETDNPSDS